MTKAERPIVPVTVLNNDPRMKYLALFIGVVVIILLGRYAFGISDPTALTAFTAVFTTIGAMVKDWVFSE